MYILTECISRDSKGHAKEFVKNVRLRPVAINKGIQFKFGAVKGNIVAKMPH
jgi:hypothetical protein